jgi:hypothetical protein
MLKMVQRQGRREFGRRGVRGWYVEECKRLRTQPMDIFSILARMLAWGLGSVKVLPVPLLAPARAQSPRFFPHRV